MKLAPLTISRLTRRRIRRIVLIKPCCIGDVVMATPLLKALWQGYSSSTIDWAVGSSAYAALQDHPLINQRLHTGPAANPAGHPGSLLRLIRMLRAGRYDLAVVPDRSPLLGIAALLAGIPRRAGLDSAGRGFAYTVKAALDPSHIRHEAEIYLDVARALHLRPVDCWANLVPGTDAMTMAQTLRSQPPLTSKPLLIVHPGGGVNVGMTMTEKRWPADRFAALADQVADALDGQVMLIGAESDQAAINSVQSLMRNPALDYSNRLTLPMIGALATQAVLYIGNDNGVAHIAAASGGKVLMIFGPSDPHRYAPFVPPDRARAVWREVNLPASGVNAGVPLDFNWERDGVSVEEAWQAAQQLLGL